MDISLAVTMFSMVVVITRIIGKGAELVFLTAIILFAMVMTLLGAASLLFYEKDPMSGLFLLVIGFNFAQTLNWMLTRKVNKN